MNGTASAISARGVTVEYVSGGYPVRPLDGFDLDVDDAQLVVLLGPSGCGKTTLLSCLAGILRPTAGTITVAGTEVTSLAGDELTEYRRRSVGVVFQAFNLLPSLSARANVALPLRAAGWKRSAALAKADELLAAVDLAGRSHHKPGQLSGGQQQRVAVARALSLDPPVLLADEPTAHLDHVQVELILRTLRDLARPGRVVVVSTHDHRMVPLADRCIDLTPHAGAVAEADRMVDLDAGEVLFRQDDPSDVVYVVESGEVLLFRELVDGSEDVIRTVGAGDYFGELGPLLGLPRSASARALVPTRLHALDVTSFRRRTG